MRARSLISISRCCLSSSIILVSLICPAQQPQSSQSCAGGPPPSSVLRASQTAGKKDLTLPAAPDPTAHTIRLSWVESISPASTVEGYYIYRRETGPNCQAHPSQCQFSKLGKAVKGNGCTDYSVVPGHTYMYQAQTLGKNSSTSTFSNDATTTAR